ncbi:MAG: hypothetical protein MJ252_06215 [archaeon]|nr:hypothetical protein [archaeon]
MKAKSKILIATFLLTCLIYNYHQIKNRDIKNPFKVERFGGRRLNEEEEEDKVERGVDEELKDGFAKYCDAASDKFKKNQKAEKFEKDSDQKENLLVDYLKEQDTGKLLEYAKKNIAILILTCFSILTIFFWIFYCCFCCCYNDCCCKSCCCCCCCFNVAKEGKCYDFLAFVLAAGAYGAIIILGITSLSISSKFIQGTNGAFCSLFDFYRTMIEGDDKVSLPKWAGIDGASSLLSEIESSFGGSFDNTTLNEYPSSSCDNINTATCEAMKTSNPTQYGYCTAFEIEIKTFNEDIKANFEGINPEEITAGGTLSSAKDNIDGIRGLLEGFEPILDMLTGAEPILNKTIPSIFYAFFAAIAGVAAYQLAYILLLCFGCCNCCPLKFIFHVVWNLMLLLTIFTFLIGGIFSIFGIIGKDGTGAFAYIISEENFNRSEPILFGAGESNDLINTCLNGDGDLSEQLELDSIEGMDQISELSKTKEKLDEYANSPNGTTKIGDDAAKFNSPTDVTDYAACHDSIRAGSGAAGGQIGGFLNVTSQYSDTSGMMKAFNCSKYFYFNF